MAQRLLLCSTSACGAAASLCHACGAMERGLLVTQDAYRLRQEAQPIVLPV